MEDWPGACPRRAVHPRPAPRCPGRPAGPAAPSPWSLPHLGGGPPGQLSHAARGHSPEARSGAMIPPSTDEGPRTSKPEGPYQGHQAAGVAATPVPRALSHTHQGTEGGRDPARRPWRGPICTWAPPLGPGAPQPCLEGGIVGTWPAPSDPEALGHGAWAPGLQVLTLRPPWGRRQQRRAPGASAGRTWPFCGRGQAAQAPVLLNRTLGTAHQACASGLWTATAASGAVVA